jgi:hypothetical protein
MDTIEPARRTLGFQVYEALMSNARPSCDVEIHSFHNDGKFSNRTFSFFIMLLKYCRFMKGMVLAMHLLKAPESLQFC